MVVTMAWWGAMEEDKKVMEKREEELGGTVKALRASRPEGFHNWFCIIGGNATLYVCF